MLVNLAYNLWLPLISGLIGWFTNFIAIKMIFRPRRPIPFLGIKIQGLVPKRKSELARSIGEAVEKELVSQKDVAAFIKDAHVRGNLMKVIEDRVDVILNFRLSKLNPLLGGFLAGELHTILKKMIVSEIERLMPGFVDSLLFSIEDKLEFRKLIADKIEKFDLAKFEAMLSDIASKEMRYIEVLGGVMGFAIGLVQLLLLALVR